MPEITKFLNKDIPKCSFNYLTYAVFASVEVISIVVLWKSSPIKCSVFFV